MNTRVKSILATAIALVCATASQAQTYTVTPVETPSGLAFRPYDMNNSGQVVGYVSNLDMSSGVLPHVFVSAANGQLPQAVSAIDNSYGRAINDAGQAVASYKNASGIRQAFLTDAQGNVTQITDPSGTGLDAFGLNNNGQVAGQLRFADGSTHAIVTGPNGQGITDLGTLGGTNNAARSVNDLGQAVGYLSTADGHPHAFITNPQSGSLIDLGTMGGTGAYAWAINNSGQAAGYFYTGTGARGAFITNAEGNTTFIGAGLNLYASIDAYDINNAGQVVGTYCLQADGSCHGYVTGPNGLGLTTLDQVISQPTGTELGNPLAINDRGQILMMTSNSYYVATPSVPEPSVHLMVVAGLIGMAAAKRRRTSRA